MTHLDFSDLEDLDALERTQTGAERTQIEAGHRETCPKCHGTGRFVSYSGRVLGECFTCGGAGHRVYKQSAAKRKANREAVAKRTQNKRAENLEAVRQEYPAEVAYLLENLGHEFTNSLHEYAQKKGYLSEGQVAALRRGMLRDETRAAERAARVAEVPNLSNLRDAFTRAAEAGLKRPTLRVEGFVFSKAPDTGANAGHLYVKNEGEYLGKINPEGSFQYVRSCPNETVADVVRIASNLLEAATAHGKRTGQCSCCGRELTNADSIEAGIGPVCAEKWGL